MKVARAMFGAALDPMNNQIFAIGGINLAKEEIADCEVFDIK